MAKIRMRIVAEMDIEMLNRPYFNAVVEQKVGGALSDMQGNLVTLATEIVEPNGCGCMRYTISPR